MSNYPGATTLGPSQFQNTGEYAAGYPFGKPSFTLSSEAVPGASRGGLVTVTAFVFNNLQAGVPSL